MTERIYKCIAEVKMERVQQGMVGEQMNLRQWMMSVDTFLDSYENLSDISLIDYLREYRGKILEEVYL